MKPTKRKGFNFLRSYFDALNEIPENEDKLSFLLAIINKQFLDEDPEDLSFIAKISYQGQRHSIEKSVKGYKDKMRTDLKGNPIKDPKQGGTEGGCQDPKQQEKEEEQEKEQDKEQEKEKLEINENDKSILYEVDLLKQHYLTKEKVIKAIISNNVNNVIDKKDLFKKLDLFEQDLIEQGKLRMSWIDFTSYFRNCLKIDKYKIKKQLTRREIQKQQESNLIL